MARNYPGFSVSLCCHHSGHGIPEQTALRLPQAVLILAPRSDGARVTRRPTTLDGWATMKVEVELSPVVTAAELQDLARLVDEARADRLGISDVALLRDSFLMQTVCAEVTRHVHIGSLVSNPYVRHPAVVATTLATLNELSQGRAFLGIGVGAGLSGLGVDQSRPAELLEEFLLVVGRLLTGDNLDWEGQYYRIKGARIDRDIACRIPVVVGTRSRRVATLAGRMADAVVVGAREMTADALARYRDWVYEGARAAGRDPQDVEIAPRVTVCVSNDGDAARRSVTLYTAHYLTLGGQEQSDLDEARFDRIRRCASEATGWYFESDVSYPPELDTLITPDLIDRYAIAGTPAECLEKVLTLGDMGYRSVSMNVAAVRRPGDSMYAGLRETVAGLAEIMDDIRRI